MFMENISGFVDGFSNTLSSISGFDDSVSGGRKINDPEVLKTFRFIYGQLGEEPISADIFRVLKLRYYKYVIRAARDLGYIISTSRGFKKGLVTVNEGLFILEANKNLDLVRRYNDSYRAENYKYKKYKNGAGLSGFSDDELLAELRRRNFGGTLSKIVDFKI